MEEKEDATVFDMVKDKNVLYLSIAVVVFSIFLACFLSVVVALVVLTSFGAGLLVPYVLFREGKHLPNLLVVFLGSEGEASENKQQGELRRSCSVCGGEQCSRQVPASLSAPVPGPHHPHIHVTAPRCVDDALEELLTMVLDEHVYSWYREFSVHDQLADEIRNVIRYAVCVLVARLQQVDVSRVLTERLLPAVSSHLDQYVEGGRRVRGVGGLEAGVLAYCKGAGWLHPALENREAEAEYLRSLIGSLKPFLLPNKYQASSVADSFLKELLGRFLLLQLMDFLAEPDTINLLLLLLLNPNHLQQQQQRLERQQQQQLVMPSPQQQPQQQQGSVDTSKLSPTSSQQHDQDSATKMVGDGASTRDTATLLRSQRELQEPVLLLKNFASVNTHPRNSSVRNNLSAVLKDQTLLYLFHTFLKEEAAINILQFCLAVEDFNRHILDPELSASELKTLHDEALDLYHTYMAAGAVDKVPFPNDVVQQIRDMVHSEASAIVKLRTTRPLFQAYEHAYNLLEREYLPAFMNSHMYFAHLCGSRSSQACQKTSNSMLLDEQTGTRLQDSTSSSSSQGKNSNGVPSSSSTGDLASSTTTSGGKSVVERVGSMGRSLKSLGATIGFKPQVVPGDEDVSSRPAVVAASNTPSPPAGSSGSGYPLEDLGEDAFSSLQEEGSSSPRGRRGLEGLASGSYRDLSAWRVTIPKLDFVPDPTTPSKMTHFFVIDVTRIDVAAQGESSEETHWQVLRRFHEFYILESKLTEFHGEFQYNTLPSRRSLFTSTHASDFMATRRQIFEEYLQKLLQTPALRKSQLLFLFLKSKDEFTSGFLPDVSLGRLLRDVPRKLVKERGQHLEPFITLFLQAAQLDSPKKLDTPPEEATEASEGLTSTGWPELHPLLSPVYGDNVRSLPQPPAHTLPHPPPPAPFTPAGILEMIMYIGVRVYGVGVCAVRWLVALQAVAGSTVDAALLWFIRRRLAAALNPHNIVKVVHLLRDALVSPVSERSASARRRRELELRASMLALLPPCLTRLLLDDDSYKEGANTLVSMAQHPVLNKQLSYVLLDQLLEELFPELGQSSTASPAGNDGSSSQAAGV